MARGFSRSTVTLAAATAVNLAALLVTEGYAGRMLGSFLEIDPQAIAGDVYMGDDSTVTNSNGRQLQAIFSRNAQKAAVDPSRIWLYSVAGGEIGVTFEPL